MCRDGFSRSVVDRFDIEVLRVIEQERVTLYLPLHVDQSLRVATVDSPGAGVLLAPGNSLTIPRSIHNSPVKMVYAVEFEIDSWDDDEDCEGFAE